MKKLLLSIMALFTAMASFAGDFPNGKVWDFTNVSVSELTNATLDGSWPSTACWFYYKNYGILNGNTLKTATQGDTPFALKLDDDSEWGRAKGLKFYLTNQNQMRIYVTEKDYNDGKSFRGICLTNSNAYIRIPNLKAGQQIAVTYSHSYTTDAVTPSISNVKESAPASTADVQTFITTVKDDGNVDIKGNKLGIRKIIVYPESTIINGSGYATFSFSEETAVPTSVEAYTASVDESAKTITCTKIEDGIIPANEGVLLKGTASSSVVMAASATSKANLSGNDLKPNLTQKTKSELGDHIYVLSGESIMLLSSTGTLAAGRAYFQLTQDVTASAAKDFTFIWNDGETTGINAVATVAENNSAAYNLAGQRVVTSAKGIVIVNGKKYLNK